MPGTACLAIGVGDAPPLAYLRGAVNGAHAIARWAREEGMETRLLTDEKLPLEVDDVRLALEELLAPVPEHLVIYFAGHGLTRGAGEDLWLLSRWQEENCGVHMDRLRDLLAFRGLKRVSIISDACRSPVDVDTQLIHADPVLKARPFEELEPQYDIWKASSRGRAAFMIPGATPEQSRCIFSGLLEEALYGVHEDVLDKDDPARPVLNYLLAYFLEQAVPERAAKYGVSLRPQINTGIRPPNHRYRRGAPPAVPDFPPWPAPEDARLQAMSAMATDTRIAPPPGASWTSRGDANANATREMAAAPGLPRENRAPVSDRGKEGNFPRWLLPAGALATLALVAAVGLSLLGGNRDPAGSSAPDAADGAGLEAAMPWIGLPLVAGVVIAAAAGILLLLRSAGNARERGAAGMRVPVEIIVASAPSATLPPTLEMVAAEDAARTAAADAAASQQVESVLAGFRAEARPDHFETGAGLVVAGATATMVLSGGKARAERFEDGRIVRLNPPHDADASPCWLGSQPLKRPFPIIVQLSTGDWAPTAAMPHFLLTLGVGASGVETALFRAMYEPPDPVAEVVVARLFATGLSSGEGPDVVAALRSGKHADPMLGVIAAWLHHAMGDIDNVRRTAFYFAQAGQPVPFDLALIGRLPARRDAEGILRVAIPPVEEAAGQRALPAFLRAATPAAEADLAGAVPFLRQGWAMLDPDGQGDLYPPGLAALLPHLRPAPFTTLDEAGGRRLADLLFPGTKE